MEKTLKSDGDGKKSKKGSLKPLLILLVILAIGGYIGLFYGVRTEKGRKYIESWLSKNAGIELTVGKTELAFPFTLICSNVKTKGADLDLARMEAEEVDIALMGYPDVGVKKCTVNVVRIGANEWAPEYFKKLGELPVNNITQVSLLTQKFRTQYSLHTEDLTIKWMEDSGKILAQAGGIQFSVKPAKIPEHKMFYYKLVVGKYEVPGGDNSRGHDITRKWLASEENPYIELSKSGSDGAFWEISK